LKWWVFEYGQLTGGGNTAVKPRNLIRFKVTRMDLERLEHMDELGYICRK